MMHETPEVFDQREALNKLNIVHWRILDLNHPAPSGPFRIETGAESLRHLTTHVFPTLAGLR